MRRHLGLVSLSAAGAALGWACSQGSPGATAPESDSGVDSTAVDSAVDSPVMPGGDASTVRCALFDMSDPVALCTEKVALRYQLAGAYTKGAGVAPSWDAITGVPGTGHSWRDDVGFASSIASYHCSSAVYGDSELTPKLDAILPDLARTILAELPAAPSGYDGEDYFRLRNAAVGLSYVNDATDATAMAALADAFGRNLQTGYAQAVLWTASGGADAGDSGDAGAGDGGEAGGAPPMTSTLLGMPDGQGHVVYAPAQVVMGAAALLDMAVRHGSDPNAGGDVATWVATALSSLEYVWARGRDATTGLFYLQLVTSGDPGHDALGQGSPAPDALLTDAQAEAVLGLARVQDRLVQLQGGVDAAATSDGSTPMAPVYGDQAATIVQALVTMGLFDGILKPPTPPPPGAFMAGFIPSADATDTNKTTLGNAWLLGGFHRVETSGTVSPSLAAVLGQLRAALVQQTPVHSSLYSVVTGASGASSIQTDYLRATSKDYQYATVFSLDGGADAQEPAAQSYRSDAVAAMVEGFTQLWAGTQNAQQCAP